jgi:pimeloyl-ACP methyl ester carboxylesterase
MVEELHTLLVNAEIQGPLVMVGHSMGGVLVRVLVRVYTHNYPEEVVGMVLVDSVQEEQFLRYPEAWAQANEAAFGQFRMLGVLNSSGILALMPGSIPNRGLPDDAFAQYQASLSTSRYFQTSLAEWESEEDGFAEVLTLQIESFEDMPLMVLRRGHPEPSSLISDTENQQIWEIWQEWHIEMAGLSSVGKLVVAPYST